MYPWIVFWAPHLYFPWSGSVAQRIEPDTNWFFGSIAPNAGDATIEKKAFDVASYGRQLGLITEVLIDLVEKVAPESQEAKDSLARLKDIKARIDGVKREDADSLVRDIELRLDRLKRVHQREYPRLRAQFEQALGTGERSGSLRG
jgi:cell division septum initiation protein DivIVA